MKRLSKLMLLLAALGLPAAAAVALLLAVQPAPLVAEPVEISVADIARMRRLTSQIDPRRPAPGRWRGLLVSQDDATVLLNLAAHRFLGASARVVFQPGSALLQASLALPTERVAGWLNIDVGLREAAGLPVVAHLRVGRLPLPSFVADHLLAWALARSQLDAQARLVAGMVRGVRFRPAQLQVAYEWQPDAAARLIAGVGPQLDHERLKAYSDLLVALTALGRSAGATLPGEAPSMSLSVLLPPMFALARQRSANVDAAQENRAALLALVFYVNGRGLAAIVPAARSWPRAAPLQVTLSGRDDFPQHFLVSAAIGAEAGGSLSDAIGLYKEIDDSRVGSGFSFRDIAADRAGSRFGQLAAAEPSKLQSWLTAATLRESDLMPDVADLPEYLPEAEFQRRYGGIGGAAYRQIMADVEARIGALAIYRRVH